VHAVAISCGYALTILTLAAIWKSLHEAEPRRCRGWVAAASLAYGLAIGVRPSLLLGAIVLMVPVARYWRERRKKWAMLLAATGPILLIALGLALYNQLRFDNPLEFGWHYQLSGYRQLTARPFGMRFLWFNSRVYFLEPAHWSSRFPFVHDISLPALPLGTTGVETPFGVLTSVPLVWLALAVPLGWCDRSTEARSSMRGFLAAVALLFAASAFTLILFCSAANRYEVEFLPELVLLAVVGGLGLERRLAGQPFLRRAVRWGESTLLGFAVAFNLLASVEPCAKAHNNFGNAMLQAGKVTEAIAECEQALRLKPDYAEAHNNLGNALLRDGRVTEAIEHCKQALRLTPDYAEAHDNLGNALLQAGRLREAIGHYEQALRIRPNDAEVHNNLGSAFFQTGRVAEAIAQYEQALRIRPDSVEIQSNLARARATQ